VSDVRELVRAALPGVRADLERLVRIPSVSAPGWDGAPVRQSAQAVAEVLRASGADARVVEVPDGRPAVVGRVAGPPGAPTVLLYAHHDVQPPGPAELWTTPPYEPSERGGRLFGRGSSDDKAGVATHAAALRAWGGKPPVGIALFIEGEEESGSAHLGEYLARERETLRCDAVVVADAGNWRVGQPALTTTLRGTVACTVEVRTADHAVHSGQYGGPVPDALSALAHVLSSLHDERGRVRIPGLARAGAGAPAERSESDPLDLSDDELRAYAGVRPSVRLLGDGTLTSRLWHQPAVSVLAIDATPVREASNQLVPFARARVSLRIPPGQDGAAAMAALGGHLEKSAPWGAEVTVIPGSIGEPFVTSTKSAAYRAMRDALRDAWGREPLDIGIGGSIPFLHELTSAFPGVDVVVTGMGDPESNAHSENESLHLGDFASGCVAEALFLERLANVTGGAKA